MDFYEALFAVRFRRPGTFVPKYCLVPIQNFTLMATMLFLLRDGLVGSSPAFKSEWEKGMYANRYANSICIYPHVPFSPSSAF